MTKVLRIIAKPATGFRRGGIHHPAEPIDHPFDAFTAKERKALEDEPNLVVQELDLPDKPAQKSGGKANDKTA